MQHPLAGLPPPPGETEVGGTPGGRSRSRGLAAVISAAIGAALSEEGG
jgi:hypothetical protein